MTAMGARIPDEEERPAAGPTKRLQAEQALGFLVAVVFALGFPSAMATLQARAEISPRQAAALVATVRLRESLRLFYEQARRPPRAQDGLAVLVPDFVDRVPLDPWGRPYAARAGDGDAVPDAVTLGEDGKPGGRGEATDVSGRSGLLQPAPVHWVNRLARTAPFGLLLVGAIAARRHPWGAGLVAGLAGLTSFLLLTVIAPAARLDATAWFASVVGLLCLTGSVAILRRAPGATVLTPAAVIAAYALLEQLVAG